jgi:hypothetical protein
MKLFGVADVSDVAADRLPTANASAQQVLRMVLAAGRKQWARSVYLAGLRHSLYRLETRAP